MKIKMFEGNPDFAEALDLAKEAKEQRKKAEAILKDAKKVEERAVTKFKNLRKAKLEELIKRKEELEQQLDTMRKEYRKMFSEFCKVRGCHLNSRRTVITSHREIAHSFSRGSIYPTETYCTCKICGNSNDPARFDVRRRIGLFFPTQEGVEFIKKAAESDEKPEVREYAKKIFAYHDEIEKVEKLYEEAGKNIEELCRIFGHDAELISYDKEIYKCKCCGKTLSYQEYINAHYAAPLRGGIVSYNYVDENPIL